MNILWGSEREPELNARLSQWASVKIFGNARGFGPCTTMGIFKRSSLVAVAVFHEYNREAGIIEISGASDDKLWMTRQVLWEMFSYAFDQLGCQMVVQRASEKNIQANGRGLPRLFKAYGYTTIRIPRLYGRDEDGVLYCLTDDAWRANGFHKPMQFSSPLADTVAA